jgi:hypothetical protein
VKELETLYKTEIVSSQKLAAEAGDISGTQRKRIPAIESLYQATTIETQ